MEDSAHLAVLSDVFDHCLNAEGLKKFLLIEQPRMDSDEQALDFIHNMDITPDLVWRVRRFEDKENEQENEFGYTWYLCYEDFQWHLYTAQRGHTKRVMVTTYPRQIIRRLHRVAIVGLN